MKNKIILLFTILFLGMGLFSACNKSKKEASKDQAEVSYSCPMHPNVHEHEPGKCPECGMDLVKEKADGHEH